jgi:hypothetical protein
VDIITSKENLEKLPVPIKLVLGIVAQFAKGGGKIYARSLIITRFFAQALKDPSSYELVPGSRYLPPRVRRNVYILGALLQAVMGT